ncbi:hypothetical protein Pcac1_g17191 [Phytophthora cactorum]|nr:hypothetical protein Pcac1_g17191 [Phytophthora cactorum]
MAFFNQVTKAALALLTLPFLTAQAIFSTGDDARCAFDEYTDTVTTFTSNSTYFFPVFFAANQDKKKLPLFFQGGARSSSLITTEASLTDTGIMNHSLDSNVFNAYNIVYLSGAAR